MGKAEIEQFLTSLAVERNVAASTQNQALAALLFLYKDVLEFDPGWLDDVVRAKRPARLPTVLTQSETEALLRVLRGVSWIMAMLLYGAGLRLKECLRLRVKDLILLPPRRLPPCTCPCPPPVSRGALAKRARSALKAP